MKGIHSLNQFRSITDKYMQIVPFSPPARSCASTCCAGACKVFSGAQEAATAWQVASARLAADDLGSSHLARKPKLGECGMGNNVKLLAWETNHPTLSPAVAIAAHK